MAFDTSAITSVSHQYQGGHLILSWTTSADPGVFFQIYAGSDLVAVTQALTAALTPPRGTGLTEIRIGAVGPGEQMTDFSSSFTPASNRATLSWLGGAYQGDNLGCFRIYGAPSPGAPVSYAKPLATIVAYEQGDDSEGYGKGAYGSGGYGDANTFTWTSQPLKPGTWSFAIVSVSRSGNEGTPMVAPVTIVGPPMPPARNTAGKRLTYGYAESKITLTWLASPA
jgi:hypothetical protein